MPGDEPSSHRYRTQACVGPIAVALVVCVGAGLSDLPPTHQVPGSSSPRSSLALLGAVRDYRARRVARAITTLLRVDIADIDQTVGWLDRMFASLDASRDASRESNAPADVWTVPDVTAAAVALIDVGYRLTEAHALLTQYFSHAVRLIELQRPRPGSGSARFVLSSEVRREGYLAMVLTLQFLGDYAGLANMLDYADRRFPTDENLLLAAGTLAEELAWEMRNGAKAESAPLASTRIRRLASGSRTSLLKEAEARYRAACAIRPESGEATLRLGRVLIDLDRNDDAMQVLRPLLMSKGDGWLAFLARMFAGASCEALKRYEEAVGHYAIAIAYQPRAQSARTALSHVLRLTGRVRESEAAAREALWLQSDRLDDPWLEYHNGQSRWRDEAMARLRELACK